MVTTADGKDRWRVHDNESVQGQMLQHQPLEHGQWTREEYENLESTIATRRRVTLKPANTPHQLH